MPLGSHGLKSVMPSEGHWILQPARGAVPRSTSSSLLEYSLVPSDGMSRIEPALGAVGEGTLSHPERAVGTLLMKDTRARAASRLRGGAHREDWLAHLRLTHSTHPRASVARPPHRPMDMAL